MRIRIATNEDGPQIGKLVEQNGFEFGGLDWTDIEPYWLVVEDEGIVGAVQIAPGKPVGRLEMLAVDPSLEGFAKGRVVSKLLRQAIATLKMGGAEVAMGSVPFELKSYKRVLKKHGCFVVSSGNLMVKRLK